MENLERDQMATATNTPFEHRTKQSSGKSRESSPVSTVAVIDEESNIEKPPDLEEPKEEEWEYVTGVKLFAVIGVVTLACFVMLLDTSIVATAIPEITTDFHALNDVGWYGSSYLLATCALTTMAGKLYSRYNSKWIFMIFLGVFEFGSLLCGVAVSSNMFIIARAVAGLGSAGLVNGALTIIAACVPLEKRAAYLGFMMSFCQLGIMLGPLVGGLFTQHVSWRWCFYINLPAGGIVAAILVFVHIPQRISPKMAKRMAESSWRDTFMQLDIPGFLLFAPTAMMLLLALQWGGTTYAWSSATIIGLFCGSAGMASIFGTWEYKHGEDAMLPWSMISQRIVASSAMVMLFFFGSQLILTYYLAIYFQAVKGVSPTLSGVYFLPSILSQIVLAVISGVLVGKLGYYLPWAVGSAVLASIGAGLISTFTPTTAIGTWIGYQILAGVGRGAGLQMPIVAIQNAIPQEQISVGMSLVAFGQTFGGALFLAFAQTCFSGALREGLREYAPEVSVAVVEAAGASGFRSIVPPSSVHGVVEAYNESINKVFYIAAAASATCFFFAWGIGWKDIRKKKVVEPVA